MLEKTHHHDIVIAGAGLVGLCAALALAELGLSVQLLETHLPDILAQTPGKSRPISLSFGSHRILKSLGVWDQLNDVACPILSVHVSEKGKFGFTQFTAHEENVPALGFVVPFNQLQLALYEKAAASDAITITPIRSIEKITRDDSGATIITDSAIHHSHLFIAADGTQSVCRDLLHIRSDKTDTGDIAHIYGLNLSAAHNHIAYERFTSYGVLAILPLQDVNRAQLVWTITPRIADKIASWDEKIILSFLQDTFEGRLPIADIKKIAQFPLKTTIATEQVVTSAMLLGNAAHTIYPVAAQGFNLGLHDVAMLRDVLFDALQNKKRIGDLSVLKEYETQALVHQEKIYRITGQLTGLFELPLIGCSRGLGLLVMDILKPLKRRLARRTMGMR